MNKIKKTMAAAAILIGTCAAPVAAFQSFGQELTNEAGETVDANTTSNQQKAGGGSISNDVSRRYMQVAW